MFKRMKSFPVALGITGGFVIGLGINLIFAHSVVPRLGGNNTALIVTDALLLMLLLFPAVIVLTSDFDKPAGTRPVAYIGSLIGTAIFFAFAPIILPGFLASEYVKSKAKDRTAIRTILTGVGQLYADLLKTEIRMA